jgi:hypothetical protein
LGSLAWITRWKVKNVLTFHRGRIHEFRVLIGAVQIRKLRHNYSSSAPIRWKNIRTDNTCSALHFGAEKLCRIRRKSLTTEVKTPDFLALVKSQEILQYHHISRKNQWNSMLHYSQKSLIEADSICQIPINKLSKIIINTNN